MVYSALCTIAKWLRKILQLQMPTVNMVNVKVSTKSVTAIDWDGQTTLDMIIETGPDKDSNINNTDQLKFWTC